MLYQTEVNEYREKVNVWKIYIASAGYETPPVLNSTRLIDRYTCSVELCFTNHRQVYRLINPNSVALILSMYLLSYI